LFQLEQDIRKTYSYEIELIVMFQMLLVQYAHIYKEQKMKYLFTFLVERRAVLLAKDIVVNIPANVPLKIQCSRVIS
jgi:Calpain family cysteine protease